MFTNREILNIFKGYMYDEVIQHILNKSKLNLTSLDMVQKDLLKSKIKYIFKYSKSKLESCSRNKARYEIKHKDWLDSNFDLDDIFKIKKNNISPGRPQADFEELSERSKRRRILKMSSDNKNDPYRILMSAEFAAKKCNDKSLAKSIKSILLQKSSTSKTPEEALAFILDNNASKNLYINMRLATKSCGADIWPSYHKVREAKQLCRPSQEEIYIDEQMAECKVEPLLHHTASRVLVLQNDVLTMYSEKYNTHNINAVFIFSWGFDGSSGYSEYKQGYFDKNSEEIDSNLFAITCIPLRLITNNGEILWNNPCSQSARYCRPIALKWMKESRENIISEHRKVQSQIEELSLLNLQIGQLSINIHFSLHLTLIDGKVLNVLTDTKSSQVCPICKCTPKQFNDVVNVDNFIPDPNALQYGISPLHSWIRVLECCLNLSYRINIKKWQIRKSDIEEFNQQKQKIQTLLWQHMSVKVDKPRPGGNGTSNDGNTARKVFSQHRLFAELLGLDVEFVENLYIILLALSTHLSVDIEKFNLLCRRTLNIYINNYKWYYMPATLHKILIHGATVMEFSILPVGMFAEEASEARNKNYKNFRESHSRKCNRISTLEDMFYRAMDSSDPKLSSLNLWNRMNKHHKEPLPPQLIQILLMPELKSASIPTTDEENIQDCFDDVFKNLDNFELITN